MAPKKNRRLLLFLPDGERTAELRSAALAAYKGLEEVTVGPVPAEGPAREERAAELARKLQAASSKGLVVVDPPSAVEDLAWLDDVFRQAFGRRKRQLPVAVFFSPRSARKKEEDPYAEYRATYGPRFHYYRRHRRSVTFQKPKPRAARKAVRVATKRRSPIRWGLLGPMALTTLAIGLVLLVFRDGLLRYGAVAVGQTAFGAKVEIADLQTTFSPSLRLDDVAVADRDAPMRNFVEFGGLEAGFDLLALLGGRVHVDRAELSGLAFGTPRETSGALEEGPPPEPSEEEEPGYASQLAGRFDQVVEELARKLEPPAPEDLETVRAAREIEAEARERFSALRGLADPDATQERLRALQADVEALVEDPVPESLQSLRASFESLGGLSGEGLLEDARAKLAAVKELGFSAEQADLRKAELRLDAAEKKVAAAEKAADDAKKLKKVDFTTIAKLPGLIEDVRGAIAGLQSAEKDVSAARSLGTGAVDAIQAKAATASTRLSDLRSALAAAEEGVAEAGQASAAPADLAGEIEAAAEDVRARKARISTAVGALQAEVSSARETVSELNARVKSDLDFLRGAQARLSDAAARDVDELKTRYSIEAFDAREIVRGLVGEQVFGWLELGERAYGRLRPLLGDSADDTVRTGTEQTGFTYEFPTGDLPPEELPSPRFWVREAVFDGRLALSGEPLDLSGTASDLSSSPTAVGRDAHAAFAAAAAGREVDGDLRFTREDALEVDVRAKGFPLGGTRFEGRHAPEELAGGELGLDLRAAYAESGFDATVDLDLSKLELVPGEHADLDPRLAAVLADVYTSFDGLKATFEVAVREGSIEQLSVSSDIDDELQSTFESALGGLVDEARAEARAELESQIEGPRQEALAAIARFDEDSGGLLERLRADLAGGEDLASAGRSLLEGELAARLELPALDSGAATAALREELAALTRAANAEEQRLDSESSAQTAAANALVASFGQTDAELARLDDLLAKELQRLVGLR